MRYPREPEVGVGAVVLEDNKILLVRRKYPPGAGKWSVPGGHLRLGESVYEAAARELKEETGVDADPVGIINVDEMVEYDSDGRVRCHYLLVDVLMKPKTPLHEARASSDALEVAVVPLEDAPRMSLTRTSRSLIDKIISGRRCIISSNFISYTGEDT